jgi:hypothetical protein
LIGDILDAFCWIPNPILERGGRYVHINDNYFLWDFFDNEVLEALTSKALPKVFIFLIPQPPSTFYFVNDC